MRYPRPRAMPFALVLSFGLLEGCGMGTPSEPTREETLKADEKTQDAMRSYYGNMIGKNARSPTKSPRSR